MTGVFGFWAGTSSGANRGTGLRGASRATSTPPDGTAIGFTDSIPLAAFALKPLSDVLPRDLGWSSLLPELPVISSDDHNEGFQYFGLGGLFLIGIAAIVSLRAFGTLPWRRLWPLLAVAVVCAIYAMIPSGPAGYRFALFRASGRFFWPMAYLLLASAIALSITRLPARLSMVVLFVACILQLVDLRHVHLERHA